MARLTAEMRLNLAGLQADSDRANAIIQRSLAKTFGGAGRTGLATDPSAIAAQISGVGLLAQPSRLAHEMYLSQGAKQLMALGPLTPPAARMGQAAMGAVAGMFSPWIGARLISGSGALNRFFGGAGGGGNAIAQGLFGEGGAGAFGASYLALVLATRMLKSAFDSLRRSVEEGAKLFQESAATNRSAGRIAQTQFAFQSIGLSKDAALRYSVSGIAGLSISEVRQLQNMRPSFERAMSRGELTSGMREQRAPLAQEQTEASSYLKEQASQFFQFGDAIKKIRIGLTTGLGDLLRFGNWTLSGSSGPPDPMKLRMSAGLWNFGKLMPQTGMERMGFSLVGAGDSTTKLLASIDKNIKKFVDHITSGSDVPKVYKPTNLP